MGLAERQLLRGRSVSTYARLAAALLLIVLALLRPAQAQYDDELRPSTGDGNALTISLLTFGPGGIYWERFGHNALLVRDASTGSELAYNYGLFDFEQKNFFLNFARGYMIYRVGADPLRYDLAFYKHEHRWVNQQTLALTPDQRVRLRDFLVNNAQPENVNYRYDYFRSNCSTRVRDALDEVTGGALRAQLQAQKTNATYRIDAVRLIAPDRLFAMAMDIALGPIADRPIDLWDESFVPMVLMNALQTVQIKDENGAMRPLVASSTRLLEGSVEQPAAQPPDYRLFCLAAGLAFGALLLLLAALRAYFLARLSFVLLAASMSLLSGIGGLILAAIWGLTDHWAGWENLNLLLFDPLSLLLLPAIVSALRARWQPSKFSRQISRLIALLSGIALLTFGLTLIQQNLQWVLLMLPLHLALSAAITRQPQA